MRRLSENEKKHRDMPDYVSGEINRRGGLDKLKSSLYHFVKILKDKNDRKEAQRKLNKNIRSIVDVLEDVYNIVENASYDQKLESPTEIPLGQPLSPESENVDYDVTTFTGSHAETLKKVLLRFYSKYLYIGPQIKHGDQVQQFEYNKRHILKDLDNFINMQLMKLDDDIQNENKKTMKKVIRLTEADLTRIVRRTINEMEDNQYEFDDLMNQAIELLIDLEYDEDEVYEMNDDEIIDAVKGYDDKLYQELHDMKYSKPIDKDEPYDSIGGHSMNDLKRAFKKIMNKDEDLGSTDKGEEKLQDLIEEARDILENELGFDIDEINEMSEREMVECLFDEGYDEIASEMEELLDQEGFE